MTQEPKNPRDKVVAVTMTTETLKRLDAYCREGRMRTGDPFRRTDVIREAIVRLIETELTPA